MYIYPLNTLGHFGHLKQPVGYKIEYNLYEVLEHQVVFQDLTMFSFFILFSVFLPR